MVQPVVLVTTQLTQAVSILVLILACLYLISSDTVRVVHRPGMPALLAMLGPDVMDLVMGSSAKLLTMLVSGVMDLMVALLPIHLMVLVAGVSTGLLIGVRVRSELGLTSWHSRAVAQTART